MLRNFFRSIVIKWKKNKVKRKYEKWDESIEDTVTAVITLIKSHDSDLDKAEAFNRIRIRFETYVDQRTETRESDLVSLIDEIKNLKKEQLRIKAPVVYGNRRDEVQSEKSSITSTEEKEESKIFLPDLQVG